MAKLKIGDHTVTVDDSFKSLSPDEQQRTVDEISKSLPSKVASTAKLDAPQDKYQSEAKQRVDNMEKNKLLDAGIGQRLFQGMTLGAGDELQSALQTPVEMFRHGTLDPTEGYKYAKAFQNERLDRSKKNTGLLGDAAELAGGVATGVGAARNGLTFLRNGQSFVPRSLALAQEGAAYGGITGFNSGEDEGRIKNAAGGAIAGGLTGGIMPTLGHIATSAASPVLSNLSARIDPEGYTRAQLAKYLFNSGSTAGDVATAVEQAAAEGQPMFTVSDAMGNSGQRALSNVSRSPGPGRTEAVNFLEDRQANQGRRVTNALSEGLNAPETAAQREANLTAQRTADARVNYGQARGDNGLVNVSPAVEQADRTLRPNVAGVQSEPSTLRQGDFQSAIRRARSYLANEHETLTDWDGAFNAKRDIDAMIDRGTPTEQAYLIPIRDALDEQLANSSQSYSHARDTFARQSREIDAVGQGRAAAQRGRHENSIPAFNGMAHEPEAQQSFRVGYADPLIENVSNAPIGTNKVRVLSGDGPQAELEAFAAPGERDRLMNRLDRENTMFETRRQATGGSQTRDNFADSEDAGFDPRILFNLAHGNVRAAGTNLLHGAGNALNGNTPEVRQHMARLLLQRGGGPQIRTLLEEIERNAATRNSVNDARSRALSRALLTSEADAVSEANR